MTLDERPHALAHDQVVVGQEDDDRAGAGRASAASCVHRVSSPTPARRSTRWAAIRERGGARHTPRTPGTTLVSPVRRETLRSMSTHAPREARVTSLSWIPSEAVEGSTRLAFDCGSHPLRRPAARPSSTTSRSCAPPTGSASPTCCGPGSRSTARAQITDCGYAGRRPDGLHHGPSSAGLQHRSRRSRCPTSSGSPSAATGGCASCRPPGGRTGLPAPRRVRRKPFVQWQAPLVWTTLSLTLHADGTRGGTR